MVVIDEWRLWKLILGYTTVSNVAMQPLHDVG